MGNRRIGRKRLYAIEKAGKKIDLDSGVGISGAIKSASQHRNGQEIITEIVIDLAPSGVAILGGNGNDKAMGLSGAASHITQLTVAKYGIITEIRGVLLEVVAGGHTAVAIATAVGSKNQGQGVTARVDDLNVVGEDISYTPDNYATLNQDGTADYLFVANAGGGDQSAMSSGKLIIYIHGFEEPSDL